MAYNRKTYRPVRDLRTSQVGVDFIKSFEGFRSRPYKAVPSETHWSWGFGHYGKDVPSPDSGKTITRAQAEKLLRQDISTKAATPIRQVVKVPMTQNQFDAAVSLAFNIGSGGFSGSTVLRQLNKRHYRRARAAFLLWVYAGGIRLFGLVRRRRAEMKLWRYGP